MDRHTRDLVYAGSFFRKVGYSMCNTPSDGLDRVCELCCFCARILNMTSDSVMAVLMKIVCWDVKLCPLVDYYRYFEGT
jgi:hypothetical protein